jgi:hypothetical protein
MKVQPSLVQFLGRKDLERALFDSKIFGTTGTSGTTHTPSRPFISLVIGCATNLIVFGGFGIYLLILHREKIGSCSAFPWSIAFLPFACMFFLFSMCFCIYDCSHDEDKKIKDNLMGVAQMRMHISNACGFIFIFVGLILDKYIIWNIICMIFIILYYSIYPAIPCCQSGCCIINNKPKIPMNK